MRVLVMITRSPAQCFMMDVLKLAHKSRVRRLVSSGRYPDAIMTALSAGEYVKEVSVEDVASSGADLIVTEHSAHWDLCGKR
jgi:hypothetical protein